MNYTNIFAPVSAEVITMLGSVLPIALGIFGLVLSIRLGARLVASFVDSEEEDDDD